jgi:hypothetical protein
MLWYVSLRPAAVARRGPDRGECHRALQLDDRYPRGVRDGGQERREEPRRLAAVGTAEGADETVRRRGHVERQVGLRDGTHGGQWLGRQVAHAPDGAGRALVQGEPSLGGWRIEGVLLVGGQHDLAYVGQQVGEALIQARAGADRQGRGEGPDDPVESGVPPVVDGTAHGDVAPVGAP